MDLKIESNNKMETVGIGVIGLGFGSAIHIPGFQLIPNVKVVGVASKQPEHARKVAEAYSLPRWFPSWQELLECPDIHAVTVATPPYLNEEIVLAALRRGKSVFCEKPFGKNLEQAQQMYSEAVSSGLPNMINFWFRELPAFQYLKKEVDLGRLGKIDHINIDWLVETWADPSRKWTWRSDRSQGGGVMATRAVHSFHYIEWLFGPIESICANLETKIFQRATDSGVMRDVDTEDCCNISMMMQNGASLCLNVSAVEKIGVGHRVEVIGEKYSITLSNDDPKDFSMDFGVWHGKNKVTDFLEQYGNNIGIPGVDNRLVPFVKLAQRFVGALTGQFRLIEPSFHEGLRTRLLMDMAVVSSREGRWLNVPKTY